MTKGRTDNIAFQLIELADGGNFLKTGQPAESVLVILSGSCVIRSAEQEFDLTRSNVFDETASAVYIPPRTAFEIVASAASTIAWCAGRADEPGEVRLVTSDQVACRTVGEGTYKRTVCDIIGADFDSQHLVVGETFNEPGKWSSYPPHRHDEDRLPEEADMEEIYYFKVQPEGGFGMQRVYSPEAGFDDAVVISDGTVVEIPEGYHPVAAAPGCDLYYLWMLWGEQRVLAPFDDPAFGEVKERLKREG